MNPFEQMASVLSSATVQMKVAREVVARAPRKRMSIIRNGNTAKVRAAIQRGPITAKEITKVCGLKNSGMVMALIRHDVDRGLIVKHGSTYRMGS